MMKLENIAIVTFLIAMVFLCTRNVDYVARSDPLVFATSWTQNEGFVHKAGFGPN